MSAEGSADGMLFLHVHVRLTVRSLRVCTKRQNKGVHIRVHIRAGSRPKPNRTPMIQDRRSVSSTHFWVHARAHALRLLEPQLGSAHACWSRVEVKHHTD